MSGAAGAMVDVAVVAGVDMVAGSVWSVLLLLSCEVSASIVSVALCWAVPLVSVCCCCCDLIALCAIIAAAVQRWTTDAQTGTGQSAQCCAATRL